MKYRVVIYALEQYDYTYGTITETRTREIEQYSQRIDDINVLDVIMAVNKQTTPPVDALGTWLKMNKTTDRSGGTGI